MNNFLINSLLSLPLSRQGNTAQDKTNLKKTTDIDIKYLDLLFLIFIYAFYGWQNFMKLNSMYLQLIHTLERSVKVIRV